METLNELADRIHAANKAKGFYDDAPLNNDKDGHLFLFKQTALIITEVSEALEELRKSTSLCEKEKTVYWEGDKPEGYPVEMVDALVRLLDVCAYVGFDIDAVLELKLAYNETRPYKHGRTA